MSAPQKPAYPEVKSYYESLRHTSRLAAHKGLAAVISNRRKEGILRDNISLSGFTLKCQKELRKWEKVDSRRVAWDWDVVQKKYRAHPKRFELAVWYRKYQMCGASIGKPTCHGGKLRLDFLESAPQGTPLDGLITDIVITAGVAYAKLIGATQLRIMKPVNEQVKNYYSSRPGFSYDAHGDFCYRDL
ncbi:MAG TPA: hypothetical protein ENK04_12650 [Gammaproteobacteria bacterium]|nr:hypothetical protein [Gammaproteobacteria bacterium]